MDIGSASQTEWNGGTLTNIRLHDIREQLRMFAMSRDLDNWLSLLVQMNHELYGFEDTKEKIHIRQQLKHLADMINKHQTMLRHSKVKSLGTPPMIIDSLNDMQYKLDEVFHKSGLQTALKEDAGDAF